MKTSAGIALYKLNPFRVFLVHPGGPFWDGKVIERSWSFPKGEVETEENIIDAALREFGEEVGYDITKYKNKLQFIGVQKNSKKAIHLWSLHLEEFPEDFKTNSNVITIEYPKGSGINVTFPEVDKGRFFNISEASVSLFKNQVRLLDTLYDRNT